MFNIFLTPIASNFILSKSTSGVVRLSVKKTGCSGYKYEFLIQENIPITHSFKNINFNIEEKDYKFLNDILIDLKIDGINKKIVFENPNAKNECGCGESFGIKE